MNNGKFLNFFLKIEILKFSKNRDTMSAGIRNPIFFKTPSFSILFLFFIIFDVFYSTPLIYTLSKNLGISMVFLCME